MEEEILTIEEDAIFSGVSSVNGLTGDVPLKTINGQEVTGEGDIEIAGGDGNVKSVNNVEPDEDGNIELTAATIGAQATLNQAQLNAANSGIDSTKVAQIATNATDIEGIEEKIPAQATASNQLADKAFVNSTIQTNSANFRGNWTTWATVPTNANDYPVDADGNKTPTKNDYLVVQDASDYTATTLTGTWRFKYSGEWTTDGKAGWHPEYQVNETPMTAAQLAALNSGATAALVTKLEGIPADAEANTIDSISVNGTAVTPDANKNVNIQVPTPPTVVQTTGTSTTDVMSQNAVTVLIGDIESALNVINNGGN